MDEKWMNLYNYSMDILNPHEVSRNMYVGSGAAAILTQKGNIYTGICIDKVLSVYKDGKVMPTCGACREFMMQLGADEKNIEILLDNNGKMAKLKDLMPEYPY